MPQAIGSLTPGEAVIVGTIDRVRERPGRFPLVTADLRDATGTIAAKWFGRRHLFGKLGAGDRLFVAGRVAAARGGLEINVTNHRVLRPDEPYAGEIVPVYGATKELTSRQIRAVIAKNLADLIARRVDALPAELLRRFDFP